MTREPIGIAESVQTVDGETIATVRLGAPTDADIEHLRRAMVGAHQTGEALDYAFKVTKRDVFARACEEASDALVDAASAYVAAKRARGGL